MKKIMFWMFAAAIAVAISACNNEKEPPKVEPIPEPEEEIDPSISEADRNWVYEYPAKSCKAQNFIVTYINPQAFITRFFTGFRHNPDLFYVLGNGEWNWQNEISNTDDISLQLYIPLDVPNVCISTDNISSSLFALGYNPKPELFNPIAEKNGDITYNDEYWDGIPYINDVPQYINLTCDRDYDAEHPKGTLLNDIVKIDYYTAKPFIDSKYKNRRLGDHDKSRTVELLRDFNTKQVGMLRYDLNFRLTTAPQTPGLYQFTFTYCDDTGSEISATTEQINLKARQ